MATAWTRAVSVPPAERFGLATTRTKRLQYSVGTERTVATGMVPAPAAEVRVAAERQAREQMAAELSRMRAEMERMKGG